MISFKTFFGILPAREPTIAGIHGADFRPQLQCPGKDNPDPDGSDGLGPGERAVSVAEFARPLAASE